MEPSKNTKQPCSSHNDAQKINAWMQRYVRHRGSGPFLLSLIIFTLFFVSIGGLSYLSGIFHRGGNTISFWICVALLAIVIPALFIFSMPRWGGRWIVRWGERLYNKDGQVTLSRNEMPKATRLLSLVVAIMFVSCVFGSVFLGIKGYLSEPYMQPISAVYCVPFFIFIIFTQPAIKSPIMWLWPILYAIHALAVVANIPPISLLPRRSDMLVATFGYGFLTAVVAILYNRYALYRLKRIVRKPIEENT